MDLDCKGLSNCGTAGAARRSRRGAAGGAPEKWAARKAEANASLGALYAQGPGAALEITRVQIAPRKTDTEVGTRALYWLPFQRDTSGNAGYSFSIA